MYLFSWGKERRRTGPLRLYCTGKFSTMDKKLRHLSGLSKIIQNINSSSGTSPHLYKGSYNQHKRLEHM